MNFPDDASRWVARDVFLLGRHRPARFFDEADFGYPLTILDLGCHGGYTTLDLALCYPDARVYGVEMDEAMAKVAKKNTKGLATIHNCAVWDKNTIVYYEPLGSSNMRRSVPHLPAGIPVEAQTIETILGRLRIDSVDYLKMDIEGAEWDVLHDTDWHDSVRTMYIEVHDEYGIALWQRRIDIMNFLHDNGWHASPGDEQDEIFAYH